MQPLSRSRLTSLLLAAALGLTIVPARAQSRRVLADLGRLSPPAYATPLVRSGESAPVFDEAMREYGGKRYARTADLLRPFAAVEPEDPAGNFFLSVSLMMIDEVGEAEERLGHVLAAGETPFERAGRFVLAKAAIRLGDLDAAERELAVLAGGADQFALDAAGLLPKVRAVKKRK